MPHLPRKNAYDLNRPSARQRGYNKKWERAAKRWLDKYPLCAICGAIAKLVDHITPHQGRQSLMWNRRNWQSLCQTCHNRKTTEERTGIKSLKGHDASGMPTSPDHPWNQTEDDTDDTYDQR